MRKKKYDPHKAVQFFCPAPCEGQILIGGAVIRPTNISFIGECINCGSDHCIELSPLLKEMCAFTNVVH